MNEQAGRSEPAILTELANTSLSERVRGAIFTAILEGRFDDDRLPSEDVLAQMLNVSRTTIRSALQDLQQEGVITRRRAVGTTINRHVGPSTLTLQRLVGFDWLLREKYADVRVQRSIEEGLPPADFVRIFDLDPTEACVHMLKAYQADGAQALWVRDVVPVRNLRTTMLGDDAPASLFDFSKRYCREPIDHAVVEIVPMIMRDATSALDVTEGEAFIRLHETHYTRSAQIIGYSLIDVDDTYIRFEVFRRELS